MNDNPKGQPVIPISRSTKRTKNTESGAYTSSSNANTSEDVEVDEVEVRPIGQKEAKDKAKRKGESEGHRRYLRQRSGQKVGYMEHQD